MIIQLTIAIFSLCMITAPVLSSAQTQTANGAFLGAKDVDHPDWFKESFLDLEEDIQEAADNGKRLIIYFWQPGCPYCAELINNNLADEDIHTKLRKNFDFVALNMWGDREVVQVGGKSFTEKTLADALRVSYTPTLLFFNEDRQVALRLDGYVAPERFTHALDFVAGKHERQSNFGQYMLSRLKPESSSQSESNNLIAESYFNKETSNLSDWGNSNDHAIAVYFETANCSDCRKLHESILTDKETREIAKTLPSVQYDITSNKQITTPLGQQVPINEWVQQLDIHYTPTIVFFNKSGQEILRMDSLLKTFHVQSIFDYVSSKAYLHESSFQRYISERAEAKIQAGENVDIWSY